MYAKIVNIIGLFNSLFICTMFFAGKMSGASWRKRLNIKNAIILACTVVAAYFVTLLSMPYQIFFNMCLLFIAIKLMYKESVHKSIAITIFDYLLLLIADITSHWIYIEIILGLINNNNELTNTLIAYTSLFIISIILYIFMDTDTFFKEIDMAMQDYSRKEVIQYLILIICITAIIVHNISIQPDFSIDQIMAAALIFLMIVLNIKYFGNIRVSGKRKQDYDELNSYTRRIEKASLNKSKREHENGNRLVGLKALIEDSNIEGAKKFIAEMIDDDINCKDMSILNLTDIKNTILRMVLIYKTNLAIKKDIKVYATICCEVYDLEIDDINLNDAVSIVMDNAIEAAANAAKKEISILIMSTLNEYISITITNTFSETDDNIELYEIGNTTKGYGRGRGLKFLEDIEEKSENIFINTTWADTLFVQEICIRRHETAL